MMLVSSNCCTANGTCISSSCGNSCSHSDKRDCSACSKLSATHHYPLQRQLRCRCCCSRMERGQAREDIAACGCHRAASSWNTPQFATSMLVTVLLLLFLAHQLAKQHRQKDHPRPWTLQGNNCSGFHLRREGDSEQPMGRSGSGFEELATQIVVTSPHQVMPCVWLCWQHHCHQRLHC